MTLGGKGALYLGKNEERLFAPPEVPVIDTTAAGDTFNAAFAVKLAEGWNVGKAVDYANCASSVTVSRKGAQASIPTAYQVQEFLFNRKNRAFADKPVMINHSMRIQSKGAVQDLISNHASIRTLALVGFNCACLEKNSDRISA